MLTETDTLSGNLICAIFDPRMPSACQLPFAVVNADSGLWMDRTRAHKPLHVHSMLQKTL